MNPHGLLLLATLLTVPVSTMAEPSKGKAETPINPSQQNSTQSIAEKNLMESQQYLEKNKQKPGVKTLPSGLQYEIVKEGKTKEEGGKTPGPSDLATVHYKGTLIDGTEFDSSYSRGEPATFPVNAVIPGWTEALQLMTTGAKWILTIPPNLAYGAEGAGHKIGPNATLIFEVELLGVQPASEGTNTAHNALEDIDDDG